MASSSGTSSVSVIPPKEKHDVFISFRGKDTRKTFTSHLQAALIRSKVKTYIDYELERGDEVGPALLKAIKESKISVIIFSENYADSTWCLDELAYILECKEIYGQHVIPIFYEIDPSHVRNQRESYGTAFAEHERRLKDKSHRVARWKEALAKAANLSGFDSTSKAVRHDSDLVDNVVAKVLAILNRESSIDLTGLIGAEGRIKKILLELDMVPEDVRVRFLVLWGMVGAGKTTLADAVFHGLSSQFESHCFLANVRERSGTKGAFSPELYTLRDQLLGELLGDRSLIIRTRTIGAVEKERLRRSRVLVVLDDVNDPSQLTFLAEEVPFGPGSRIIITTRDLQPVKETLVLKKSADRDVNIHEVEKLNGVESLQLFYSDQSDSPTHWTGNSESLQRRVLDYADGIPLALNILRSLSGLPQPVIRDGRTTVRISEDGYQLGLKNCKCMLIGRLQLSSTDNSYALKDLHQKLSLFWGDIGPWKIIPMGRGYYSFQFASEDCMSKIWAMGATALKPGTLMFMHWVHNFSPACQRHTNAEVWVRFWDLGLEYWEPRTLFEIANGIGVLIKVDANTLDRKIGLYARVLVAIDLSTEPPLELVVEREGGETLVLDVEYENLPLSCSHCGNVGHAIGSCKWLCPSQADEAKENDKNTGRGRKCSRSSRHRPKKNNVSQIYVAKKVMEVVNGEHSSVEPNAVETSQTLHKDMEEASQVPETQIFPTVATSPRPHLGPTYKSSLDFALFSPYK